MFIDEVANEFQQLWETNFDIKWGADDCTYIATFYGNNLDVEDYIDDNNCKDIIKKAIKETINQDGFHIRECMQVYLDCSSTMESRKQLEKFYLTEKENIKKYINKFNSIAKYWFINIEVGDIENNCGWQFLEFPSYHLTDEAIKKLKEELNQEGDKMIEKNSKLNKEAINEITQLLNRVKDVVRLLEEFGIHIDSDTWTATSFCDKEDILNWTRKDFEKFDHIKSGDKFFVGGNLITGHEHQYRYEWIIAPKKLAEVQGDIFKEYLKDVIKSISLKHFDLKFYDEYGLINNGGWEHYMAIDAIVKDSAINNENTKKLVEQICEEEDTIIELSGVPVQVNLNGYNNWEENGLKPKGNFAYMIEFFSTDLMLDEDTIYQGSFGLNSRYIKDAMKFINQVENRAKEIADKYADKGVKVTVNGLNDGCEKGMAVYVWIPYQ